MGFPCGRSILRAIILVNKTFAISAKLGLLHIGEICLRLRVIDIVFHDKWGKDKALRENGTTRCRP